MSIYNYIQKMSNDLFKKIDTEEKAYLVGQFMAKYIYFIVDKTEFKFQSVEESILIDIFKNVLDVEFAQADYKKMVKDLGVLFKIDFKNTMDVEEFPKLESEILTWHLIRGYFDVCAKLSKDRQCMVPFLSEEIGMFIGKLSKCKYTIDDFKIEFVDTNVIDFLGKLYDNSDYRYRNSDNYDKYSEYLGYYNCGIHIPTTYYSNIPECEFIRCSKEAISPKKNNASDEGYDLCLIAIDKQISDVVIRYETNIQVRPSAGYHIEILPRSSLSNSGYMLSNSIGLIDENYTGTLKVCLTKVDKNAAEITFPFKAVQMVLRKSMHFICREVDEIKDYTARGNGGFGSTN